MDASTPYLLGHAVHDARVRKGWSQADLAKVMGVSRQWVINLEKGAPNLRLGMVLDALSYLDLHAEVTDYPDNPLLAHIPGLIDQ